MLGRLIREKHQEERAKGNSVYGRSNGPPPLFPSSSSRSSVAIHRIQKDLVDLELAEVTSTEAMPCVASHLESEKQNIKSPTNTLSSSFLSRLPPTCRSGSPYLPPGTFISVDPRNPYEVYVMFCISSSSNVHDSHPSMSSMMWGGETLFFHITFSEEYPCEGPRTRFLGPHRLFHPNIECGNEINVERWEEEKQEAKEGSATARFFSYAQSRNEAGWGVCLGLQFAWRPTFMLLDLLLSLWMLLDNPNAEDPLPGNCQVAAWMWLSGDREAYVATARAWIQGDYRLVN